MRHPSWNAGVGLALCLVGCKPIERDLVEAKPIARTNRPDADLPITKAQPWCEAKLAEARLKPPAGFGIRECSTWSVDFLRQEKGMGPIWLGKRQSPVTTIHVGFRPPPKGLLDGPIFSSSGQPSPEENAASVKSGPSYLPDVNGLRKVAQPPIGWDVNEDAPFFLYNYFNDDRTVFCEGVIRQSLRCGLRGGQYFMTWSYSGRDVESSLKEMLAFRHANMK